VKKFSVSGKYAPWGARLFEIRTELRFRFPCIWNSTHTLFNAKQVVPQLGLQLSTRNDVQCELTSFHAKRDSNLCVFTYFCEIQLIFHILRSFDHDALRMHTSEYVHVTAMLLSLHFIGMELDSVIHCKYW